VHFICIANFTRCFVQNATLHVGTPKCNVISTLSNRRRRCLLHKEYHGQFHVLSKSTSSKFISVFLLSTNFRIVFSVKIIAGYVNGAIAYCPFLRSFALNPQVNRLEIVECQIANAYKCINPQYIYRKWSTHRFHLVWNSFCSALTFNNFFYFSNRRHWKPYWFASVLCLFF